MKSQSTVHERRVGRVSTGLALAALATLVGLAQPVRALATTVFFVPGDAFFHAQIPTQQLVKKLRKGGEFRVHYARPPGAPPPALCGFLGCPAIDLRGVPKLPARVLTAIRNEIPLAEGESLSVLVYPASFEVGKQRLFIKYNENWMGEKPLPGTGFFNAVPLEGRPTREDIAANARRVFRYSIAYQPFVDSAEATAHDWKFAADVPALVPEGGPADWDTVGDLSKTIGVCQYEDCVLIICNVADAMKLYRREGRASLIELRGDSATLFKLRDRDFEETSLSTPAKLRTPAKK